MTGRGRVALGVALLLGFLALERLSLAGAAPSLTAFDSGIFLRVAERSPLEPGFWGEVRPPLPPLVYRLAGRSPARIAALQSALSVAAWSALGWSLARLVRRRAARALALALPPLLSLSLPVNPWDATLMSESLFLSLLAAVIAATLHLWDALHARPRRSGLARGAAPALWLAAALALALTRDSAAYLLPLPLALLALALARSLVARGDGTLDRAACAATLVLGALAPLAGQASMRAGERWRTPLLNVVLRRVLPEEGTRALWHERYGLPENPLLLAQAGELAWNRVPGGQQLRKELERDPALADVRRWLDERGVASYQRYLLLDAPGRALSESIEALDRAAHPRPPVLLPPADPEAGEARGGYAGGAGDRAWTRALTALAYAPIPAPTAAAGLLSALALALAALGLAPRRCAVLVPLCFLAAWIQAFVGWHGDAAEVDRHLVGAGALYRLGLLASALVACSLGPRAADAPRRAPATDGAGGGRES